MEEFNATFGVELNRALLEKDANLLVKLVAEYLSANGLQVDQDVLELIPVQTGLTRR